MALRNIVKIDEEKCNGCGECIEACAEGAIEIVDGKAKLVSDIYCDGLGACLGHCPQDAITVEQRDAAEFDEEATEERLRKQATASTAAAFTCPGMAAQQLSPAAAGGGESTGSVASQLAQWPVQLKLIPVTAPYFAGADLMLVADCVPFAMGDFHSRLLKDKAIVIGCPKLDDGEFYIGKLSDIIKSNNLKSLSVVHMQVPCCSGLTYIATQAINRIGAHLAFDDIVVSLQGDIINTERVEPAPKT